MLPNSVINSTALSSAWLAAICTSFLLNSRDAWISLLRTSPDVLKLLTPDIHVCSHPYCLQLTDECNLALAKEAGQLSQSKRDIEKQLAQVKSQQWEVDKLRKQMLSRVQTLSSGPLALDSHSSKVLLLPHSSSGSTYCTVLS